MILLIIAAAVYLLTKKKPNPDELTLYGNIEIRQVDLSFQVPGQISLMLKEEGDSVKKGELVALLDDRDYKSNLEKAAADVLKTSALSKDASSKYARQAPLCADSTVSKQECDTLLNTKTKQKQTMTLLLRRKLSPKTSLIIQKYMHLMTVLLQSECKNLEQPLIKDRLFIQLQRQNLFG